MVLLKSATVLDDDVQLIGRGVHVAPGVARTTGGALRRLGRRLVVMLRVEKRLLSEADPRDARRQRRQIRNLLKPVGRGLMHSPLVCVDRHRITA